MEYNPHNTAIPIKRKTMNLLWAHHSISLLIMKASKEEKQSGVISSPACSRQGVRSV
jgi:hypothetical protein